MSKDFDIHEWRLYQANLTLLNEEENEWEFTSDSFDEVDLTVGDIITPDMWDQVKVENEFYPTNKFKEDLKIEKIEPFQSGHWVDLVYADNGYGAIGGGLKKFNSALLPNFHMVPPSQINEEDEENEWEFDADESWGKRELTVGDEITPDMIKDNWKGGFDYPIEILSIFKDMIGEDIVVVKSAYKKKNFLGKESTKGYKWEDLVSNWHDLYLKDNVKIVPPINESEDNEWEIDADEEWGVKELQVGDVITPDMWDIKKLEDYIVSQSRGDHAEVEWNLNRIRNIKTDNIKIKNIKPTDETFFGWVEVDHPYLNHFGVSWFNKFLKPDKAQIIEPLYESEDNEWEFTSDSFAEYDGDVEIKIKIDVTWEDLYNKYLEERWILNKVVGINDLKKYSENFRPFEGTVNKENLYKWTEEIGFNAWDFIFDYDFYRETIDSDPDFDEREEVADNDVHYEILPVNLNESDDDFDWNITTDSLDEIEVGVGDTITPEMWDQEKIAENERFATDPLWYRKPHKITRMKSTYLDWVEFDNKKHLSKPFVEKFLAPNVKLRWELSEDRDGRKAFSREVMDLNEGRYDGIVKQLTKGVMKSWVSQWKAWNEEEGEKENNPQFYYSQEIEDDNWEFKLEMTLHLLDEEKFGVAGGANHKFDPPFIDGHFFVSKSWLPEEFQPIYGDVNDFLRHEIEHLTQGGSNLRPGKKRNTLTKRREKFQSGEIPKGKYPIMKDEIEPHLQGLYMKSKKMGIPFKDVVQDELDRKGYTPEEKKKIISVWKKYIKGLSLPPIQESDNEWEFTSDSFEGYDGPLTVTIKGPEKYEYMEYIKDYDELYEKLKQLNPQYDWEDDNNSLVLVQTLEWKTSTSEIRKLLEDWEDIESGDELKSNTKKDFENWLSKDEIRWLWVDIGTFTKYDVKTLKNEIFFDGDFENNIVKWPEGFDIDDYITETLPEVYPEDITLIDVK